MQKKKETTSISSKEVGEWIRQKGIEGAKTELYEMAEEISTVVEKMSDIIARHPECVAFHNLTLELKVDAHAGNAVMHVLSANMGSGRYCNVDGTCDCKCSSGSGGKDDNGKGKGFEELVEDLDPEAKMMLAMLAVMGGIKK